MANRITNFMRGEIYDWVRGNVSSEFYATFPNKKDFWVIPIDGGDPQAKEITSRLLGVFDKTRVKKIRVIEDIGFAVLSVEEKTYVCGVYMDCARTLTVPTLLSPELRQVELSFLQSMSVISKLGLSANRRIDPQVWSSSPIFEADILAYFPVIICFEIAEGSAGDPDDVAILRLLISIQSGSENVREFQDELVEVLLSMPNVDHDWLILQLFSSVMCGRESGFYSGLYRMVEFFFPLAKVGKLRDSLDYKGSTLKLLDLCMNQLGWHVNHSLGSRMALDYPLCQDRCRVT